MKLFILFFLVSASHHAGADECQTHAVTIIKPALSLDPKSEAQSRRFVKDEKKALTYIQAYDVSKLSVEATVRAEKQILIDCKYYKAPADLVTCQDTFLNYDFLHALLEAMKTYGWSSTTVEKGKEKVLSYLVKVATLEDIPASHLRYSLSLMAQLNGLMPDSKLTLLQIQALGREIEADDKRFIPDKRVGCKPYQDLIKRRQVISRKFQPKFADLLREMKP